MTIKLIVGTANPVRNMPLPGTTLAHGMWIYWRIAIVRRCAKSKFFGYTSRINGGRGRPPAGPHYLYEPQR